MDPSLVEAWRREADSVLKRNNTNKWKKQLTSQDVRLFERAAGDTLELYGYETVTPAHLRDPVGRIEATLLQIQSTFRQVFTTSGDYYRRAALKHLQAVQIRIRSIFHRQTGSSN